MKKIDAIGLFWNIWYIFGFYLVFYKYCKSLGFIGYIVYFQS